MDKTMVGTEKSAGALIFQRFFEKLCKVCRKIPVLESLFNEVLGLDTCNFIEKSLQQRQKCFSVNFAKFLRTPIF